MWVTIYEFINFRINTTIEEIPCIRQVELLFQEPSARHVMYEGPISVNPVMQLTRTVEPAV